MHHPTDRITHTTAFVIPVVEHWLEREIAYLRLYQTLQWRCRGYCRPGPTIYMGAPIGVVEIHLRAKLPSL